MSLMFPRQPSEAGYGRIGHLFRRFLITLAALWLVQAPVQHALAHAASDSDHGSSDDPTTCMVCRVIAASPVLDTESPTGTDMLAPAAQSVEAVVPVEALTQSDSHPTDFARGPPARPSPVALAGRLRPT